MENWSTSCCGFRIWGVLLVGSEVYFEKLKESLKGIEECLQSDCYFTHSLSVMQHKYEALLAEGFSLNTEQRSFLQQTALDHLKMGNRGKFFDLCSILAYAGLTSEEVETSITHHSDYKIGYTKPFEIAISLLDEAGVFEDGEFPVYYDYGALALQKKGVGRKGLLVLTNRRIIVAGNYSRIERKKYKLFYGAQRDPYLSKVDYVWLDRLQDIEMRKNEIKMKYNAEYVVEKDRTFYGPYFFTFDLPPSIKVKSGEVKVIISLSEMDKRCKVSGRLVDTFMDKTVELWSQV
ncbi:MAG: hypothetical protein E3J86_03205, partial [Candidatus Thorarchaeota archaeon]